MPEVKKVVLAYSGGLDTNSSPELASFSTARKVVQALLQNLLPMRHKQQSAGVTRILFAKRL